MSVTDPDPVQKIPVPEVYEAPMVRALPETDDDTSANPYSIGPF